MNKIRDRILNFRLSSDEFERLRKASAVRGARCLSEFARSVLLASLGTDPRTGKMESSDERLLSMDRRLCTLELSMAQLTEELAGSGTLKSKVPDPQ